MNYITLYQFKRYKGLDLTVSSEDDRMMMAISNATELIHQHKDRRYDPQISTRALPVPNSGLSVFGLFDLTLMASSGKEPKLRLADDLLEVITLTNGNGEEITAEYYEAEPIGRSPKTAIKLVGENWYGGDDDRVQLTGIWGSHTDYSHAWVNSLDAVADVGGITASQTTILVTDADGVAGDLQPMRFQAGQLVRIGSEFCLVISVNTTANSLQVSRGENGSTAAVHAHGAKIEIWRPSGNVVQAALRLTAWMWSQKDVDNFDRTYNTGTGVATTPSALPVDVLKMLGARRAR